MKEILDFISELKENNNREWFEANKKRYLQVKSRHEDFVQKVLDGIARFDPAYGNLNAKDCVFRIYRDVRFSPNKDPYKTHIGAYLSPGGRKSQKPGFYVHLEPGNCFAGGGVYMPPPDVLKKIRNEIYFNFDEFKEILEEKNFKKNFSGLYEDKLTRPPKDFDPNHPGIEYLKYKSYFVDKEIPEKVVLSDKFVPTVVETLKVAQPLNKFLERVFEF